MTRCVHLWTSADQHAHFEEGLLNGQRIDEMIDR
jgi:hypothetical protein